MMKKTIFKGIRGLQIFKAAPFALLFLKGNNLLAETADSKSQNTDYSMMTIILCVVGIGVIIAVSWMIGAKQSQPDGHHDIHLPPRRHFDHPNDPHFKKIRRKTS